jgi:hypothetical protein
MRAFRYIKALWATSILTLTPLHAQILTPVVPIAATGTSATVLTPAEAGYHVDAARMRAFFNVSFRDTRWPADSMTSAVATAGREWLAKLSTGVRAGIQLDPTGRVSVAARADKEAHGQITKRLATPGLSLTDRAFTYRTAVEAFADHRTPERLPFAEQYLAKLDAMGPDAVAWQFEARIPLVSAYYQLGRSNDVARHGTRAMALVAVMSFFDRASMYWGGRNLYAATVEALAGGPGGRALIDQVNATLRDAAVPSAAIVALDSSFRRIGQEFTYNLNNMVRASERLGSVGAPLVSNLWLNRASPDSATVPVNDGKIRIIETGSTGCPACMMAMYGLQRLRDRFPEIEPVLLISTYGAWANRLVEPDQEAKELTNFFLNTAKLTYPVAIWKSPKARNADDGMTPRDAGPNFVNYPMFSKPIVWVLDGRGTIRQVFIGFNRDTEAKVAQTIQFLQAEQLQAERRTPTS